MSDNPKNTVTITDNASGKQVEVPVLVPTDGASTLDIRALNRELGYFTFDPVFFQLLAAKVRLLSSMVTKVDFLTVAILLNS